MKRSEINRIIRETEALLDAHQIKLPPFFGWTPEQWREKGHECDEIRDNALGWDVTDFGAGQFEKIGLTALTIRNGNASKPEQYKKPYAEKILIAKEGQVTPLHFHWYKMEDIINRGGGNLLIRVYNSLPDEEIDQETPVTVHLDGETRIVPAGTEIRLTPGDSLHIQQRMYHDFKVEEGSGAVLIGEVSQCNDDNTDNRFNPPCGRFPEIEEDEAPYRLLCNEYPPAAV